VETFKKVLKEYCMVTNTRQASTFANSLGCSDTRKEAFVRQCKAVLEFNSQPNGLEGYSYDQYQDYVDSLRREHYVGIGL